MPDSSTTTRFVAPAVAILLLALTAGACGRTGRPDVVARVDGTDITFERLADFYPFGIRDARPIEEEISVIDEKLDELIGFILVQYEGRRSGLHKTDHFQRRQEWWTKRLLNRILKQRDIRDKVSVLPAEVDSLVARSRSLRWVQHIVTLNERAADEVAGRLQAGSPWGEVAIQYSRDSSVAIHRGDLGWVEYGAQPFSLYPSVQERLFDLEPGEWEGPIQEHGEFHFIKVLEERQNDRGGLDQDRLWATRKLLDHKEQRMEQDLANRMWRRGGYRIDEDQFRWWVEQVQASFRADGHNNPIPVLTRDDQKRVVVRSADHPYTAQMLLDQLEIINPQGRDDAVTLEDWRFKIQTEWVITDEVAALARSRGYDREPDFHAELEKYIDGQLYALLLQRVRDSARVPTDAELEEHYREHFEDYDVPERRGLTEVLVATREEAQEILGQARGGANLAEIAAERTIRPSMEVRKGRFAPITRSEFGELGEAVFSTPVGELGPIVETVLGFSVFRVTISNPAEVIPLDRAREGLRTRLHSDRVKAAEDSLHTTLLARARIVKYPEPISEFARQAVETANALIASGAAADSLTGDPPGR